MKTFAELKLDVADLVSGVEVVRYCGSNGLPKPDDMTLEQGIALNRHLTRRCNELKREAIGLLAIARLRMKTYLKKIHADGNQYTAENYYTCDEDHCFPYAAWKISADGEQKKRIESLLLDAGSELKTEIEALKDMFKILLIEGDQLKTSLDDLTGKNPSLDPLLVMGIFPYDRESVPNIFGLPSDEQVRELEPIFRSEMEDAVKQGIVQGVHFSSHRERVGLY